MDLILPNLELTKNDNNIQECKGLYYRCDINSYYTDYSDDCTKKGRVEIVSKIRLRKIKTLSCPGCEICGFEELAIAEMITDDPLNIFLSRGFQHGKLYKPKFNFTRDYETGYEELDEIDFIECNEEEVNGKKETE